MRRSTLPLCVRLLGAAGLLLLLETAHAQRLTDLQASAYSDPGIGCVWLRCFSSVGALDGDTAITSNMGTGVLVRSAPGVWTVQQVLWNPDGMPSDRESIPMGSPLALHQNSLFLTGTSRKYNNKPVIYVWERTGTSWAHTQVLALPRAAQFASTEVLDIATHQGIVAIAGQRIGAADTLTQIDIFTRRSDGLYQRQTQLTPPTSSFNTVVALEGTTLVVGNPDADQGRGRVYIYQRGSSGWTLRNQLTAADSSGDTDFGTSVAISGNTIAVGAPLRPNFDAPLHIGAVYVFQRTATGWAQTQLLVRPEYVPEEPDPFEEPTYFGNTVSLSGDRLVTDRRAWGETPLGYLYERRGVWAPVAGLSSIPGYYAGSVLVSGAIAVQNIGDGAYNTPGALYDLPPLWELPPRVGPP